MPKKPLRDMVVLLPGITGSVLQKDGKDVWAPSVQAVWEVLASLGESLQQLRLKGDDPQIDDLGDGIRATALVPDVHLVPGLVTSEDYRDTFFAERHGSLQCNNAILTDLLGRLQRMQAVGLENVREPEIKREVALLPAISLDLDDLYAADEPVELRARLINVPESTGAVVARIESVSGDGSQVIKGEFRQEGDVWVLKKEGVPPGLYRVEVRTDRDHGRSPMAVHDLFAVAR